MPHLTDCVPVWLVVGHQGGGSRMSVLMGKAELLLLGFVGQEVAFYLPHLGPRTVFKGNLGFQDSPGAPSRYKTSLKS